MLSGSDEETYEGEDEDEDEEGGSFPTDDSFPRQGMWRMHRTHLKSCSKKKKKVNRS